MSHAIFIVDDQHPEDTAMLQALYSRSPASVVTHLEKLKKTGSGKFMDQYYVGYGHASIGDCGTTTCFIEQVSILVAKAVQENPLYNGQEASTRYLDYAQQEIVDPYDNPASTSIQKRWKEIYNDTIQKLQVGLEKKNPFDPNQYKSEKIWKNTLEARSFDIARALLPMGTTTLLSWSTSLRQSRDNLRRLKHHPLKEVREVAQSLFKNLIEKYPHSFNGNEMDMGADTARDAYAEKNATRNHYQSSEDLAKRFDLTEANFARLEAGELIVQRDTLDLEGLKKHERAVLSERPKGSPLPWRLESYGRYNFLFLLDFGSFRDIQRHRNGVCQIPLVEARFGLHPWYLHELEEILEPADFEKLQKDVAAQFTSIKNLAAQGVETNNYDDQYFYPMGTMALVHASYSLPQTLYVAELRSGKTVHGSLRPIAQKMLQVLERDVPDIALYGDMDAENFTAKRGEQTISLKAG
ncbi:MAG TPA: hypothetical protein DD400_01830 [Rhodospirillaceae bacterium]|nr:hypothetical protein [Rhodospirillaceae bacterium]